MFSLILGFSEFLATKCVSLNDEPYTIRPTLIDFNPVELKYCLFIISLDKCNGTCNVLPPKICAPKKTKEINLKHLR